MRKENQIDEMAKDICRHYEESDLCMTYNEPRECNCDCWTGTYLASKLYNAGYRKQSELTPCDLCEFNPPSSCDGKLCSMCPAQAKMKGV